MQGVQTTLPIGSIIHNRYRIEALLGKGGFGAVYRVKDQRVRGNVFALKEVIDPNEEERERFAFECSVLKRLDHPSLPRVYQEFEDTQTQRSYMLMDFVDGPNLEQLRLQQSEKRFPLARVLELMAPIFEAVSYLHSQQPPIIHRDIKPANIIVPQESQETVLVDLGIAKEYEQEGTTTAVRRCSPGYGAPEQYARGTNIRTDVYGLAATLYVLLTGVVPMDALYRMTQMGSKNLDPLESVRSLAPSVPPQVADAILRAMAINSNERFASVDEFWLALQLSPADLAMLPTTQPQEQDVPVPVEGQDSPVTMSNTGVKTVVYPLQEGTPERLSPTRSRRLQRPVAWLLFFMLLALLALGGGVFLSTSIFARHPSSSGIAAGKKPTATTSGRPISTPTSVPRTRPTPLPTTRPTPIPTMKSIPPPVVTPPPASGSYPLLQSHYNGNLSDQYSTPPVNTSMSLSNVQQTANSPSISGYFSVGPGLVGNGNFTGSVTQDKHIQFLVASYNGLAPLFFTGTIQADESMQGTYCSAIQISAGHYQCDKNVGGYGSWQLDAPAHQSSLPLPGSGSQLLVLANEQNEDRLL